MSLQRLYVIRRSALGVNSRCHVALVDSELIEMVLIMLNRNRIESNQKLLLYCSLNSSSPNQK